MLIFTSDIHLSHGRRPDHPEYATKGVGGIIQYMARPFTTLDQMNAQLIANFRDRTSPQDDIYVLGDLAMGPRGQQMGMLQAMFADRKAVLVLGNHDDLSATKYATVFKEIHREVRLTIQGHPTKLSHYPYAPAVLGADNTDTRYLSRRPTLDPGVFLLHGHLHSQPDRVTRRLLGRPVALDVGVDGHHLLPWTEDEIVAVVTNPQ